jgi:hypothetical protein
MEVAKGHIVVQLSRENVLFLLLALHNLPFFVCDLQNRVNYARLIRKSSCEDLQ